MNIRVGRQLAFLVEGLSVVKRRHWSLWMMWRTLILIGVWGDGMEIGREEVGVGCRGPLRSRRRRRKGRIEVGW
jgi:hypothetical protein